MKQVVIKKGSIIVDEVPAPVVSENGVLVKVLYSCISAGTEMSGVNESGKSILKKAIEKPEKIKKAIDIAKNQGIESLLDKMKKLDVPQATGYSASGIVIDVGKNIHDIKIGDRVACAGAGLANHAEYIEVPRNLVMRVPEGLNLEFASTVTLGGIALQGVRRADVRIGEFVAVIGMGILGQLTSQILTASGCRVIGIDIDERRLNIAKQLGCPYTLNSTDVDIIKEIEKITEGYGVDVAIITAATNSNEVLSQAFKMCRKKGKVVLVGVVGNQFNRDDMYLKELDFVISTSYGPGRYDPQYEEKGIDYPYGYVRWTENRNMEEYLRLLKENKVDIRPLIDGIYNVEDAPKAYASLNNQEKKPLILLLKYNEDQVEKINRRVIHISNKSLKQKDRINVAIVGAGEFAKAFHLPNLQKLQKYYNIYAIMSRTGLNSKNIGEQYGATLVTTDYNEILNNPDIDMVMICTRHNLHASMAVAAMKKGKAVFVEKPLAMDDKELDEVLKTVRETKVPFIVGYNRRFSKYAREVKKHIKNRVSPLIINYQMNAGYIPLDHWVHTEEGGGRIIGEACHIIDLFTYFTESEVECISVNSIKSNSSNISPRDNVVVTLNYTDGSLCTLTYTSLGNRNYPKETCNIYFDEKIITINDYKSINGFGVKVAPLSSKVPEKGQMEELVAFAESINNKFYPIQLWDLEQTSRITFLIERELKKL